MLSTQHSCDVSCLIRRTFYVTSEILNKQDLNTSAFNTELKF